LSRWQMMCKTAKVLGLDPSLIVKAVQADVPAPEPRSPDSSLDSSRWRALFPSEPWPTFEEALRKMID